MPSRILREGINSSSRINSLSPGAELFYRRLMSVVDDYGRYYAAPATLRGACWPTCPEKVSEKAISGWLEECSKVDSKVLLVYTVKGCQYLEVIDFNQPQRSRAKFPQPEIILQADCAQNDFSLRSSDFVVRDSNFDIRSSSLSPSPPAPVVEILSPLEAKVQETAKRIYERHPQKRRCPLSQVTAKMRAIAKTIPGLPDKLKLLTTVDETHAEWCDSHDWQKDGGEYAKGLDNWLAPTMCRWTERPVPQSHGPPDKALTSMQNVKHALDRINPSGRAQ